VFPLVFLHGVGGGKAVWDRQTAHFRALGYRCTAWDQPGYGHSPLVDPYTFEKLADALAGLIGEKAVLVGHSMVGLASPAPRSRSVPTSRASSSMRASARSMPAAACTT
jgi:alpha-beta hydrolase superfamily lysophospholipase